VVKSASDPIWTVRKLFDLSGIEPPAIQLVTLPIEISRLSTDSYRFEIPSQITLQIVVRELVAGIKKQQ
jgi:hypothetical protein